MIVSQEATGTEYRASTGGSIMVYCCVNCRGVLGVFAMRTPLGRVRNSAANIEIFCVSDTHVAAGRAQKNQSRNRHPPLAFGRQEFRKKEHPVLEFPFGRLTN